MDMLAPGEWFGVATRLVDMMLADRKLFYECREGRPPETVSQGPLNGGFPDLDLSFLFCPFWDFPDFSGIFPICPGALREFSRFVLFLFLGLLTAPTRNSPERVRDTIWTFPEKSGKPPGLETPRFGFSQVRGFYK